MTFDDPAVVARRSKAEQFLVDGVWPRMSDLKWQWFEDAQVLVEIGRALRDQALPIVDVRLPAALGDHAVAAWTREDKDEPDGGPVERMYRQRAAAWP